LNKPFLRTASTILLFVLVSVVPAWRLVTEPHQSVTLRDGTRFTLLRTSWGKVHRFGGSPLSGLVSFLPPLPPAWTPGAPYEMTTPIPSIGLWVRAEGPSAEELSSVAWEIIDGTGAAIRVRPSTHHVSRPGEPATMGFAFTAFPRRDPAFKLQGAFDRRGPNAETSGEFDVPNPIPKRERRGFPAWTAEPVPAMRKVGDLEIELIRLLTCSSWDGKEIRKAQPKSGGQAPCAKIFPPPTLSDLQEVYGAKAPLHV